MELDTGSVLSVINIKTLKSKLGENHRIRSFNGNLKIYSEELIQPLAIADAHVKY